MSEATPHLARHAQGHWTLQIGDQLHANVVVVRAFPIRAPDESVSVLDPEGHELWWLPSLSTLTPAQREAVQEALQEREFMPEIERVEAVSSYTTPSTWTVQTHRGRHRFVLRGEEDIRRLSGKTLIVADAHGVQYLIRDLPALDRHSRKLLDRFL